MRPSPLARSLRLSLALFGLVVAALGAVALALDMSPGDAGVIALYSAVYWIYLGAGITAWWRRPGNRVGAIIVAGGFAVLGAGLGNSQSPILQATGAVCATLILAVLVHLLLAFPSGRVRGTGSVILVVGAYTNSVLLQAPAYLFGSTATSPLHVATHPELAVVADVAQGLVGVAISIATVVVVVRRLLLADSSQQRVLIPLFSYGVIAMLFIPFSAGLLEGVFGLSAWSRGMLQLVVLGGVPIAFTLGVLRGGFARTADLSEFGSWIGSAGRERSAVVAALARTIGDPGVQVAFWLPDRGIHVDAAGTPTVLPRAGDNRAAVDVEIDGRRVGAIVYDANLIPAADHVRAAGRLAALALDRQRLTAELLVSERALARARARIDRADAPDAEAGNGLAHLTVRQRQVLALIAGGRSNAAIARELSITEKSVVNHISRLYDALDLPVAADDHRRVQATIRYLGG